MTIGWVCRQCRTTSRNSLPSTTRYLNRSVAPEARLLQQNASSLKSETRPTTITPILLASGQRSISSARILQQDAATTQIYQAALAQDIHPPAPSTTDTTTTTPSSSASSRSLSRVAIFSQPPYSSPTHIGRVTRVSTMHKTVQVTTTVQEFAKNLQKHYTKPSRALVHDPANILIEGDVIEYGLFPEAERQVRQKMRVGKRVRFVVRGVVTPFGTAVEDRVPKMRYDGSKGTKTGEKEKGKVVY